MVAALTGATLVAPLTGSIQPHAADALPQVKLSAAASGTSWTQVMALSSPTKDFDRVTAAASRARVRTPLQVTSCDTAGQDANGYRDLLAAPPIVWPMQEGTFNYTSPFAMRYHPILGVWKMHEGIDLAGPAGTSIFAVSDGEVLESHPDPSAGYWLLIKHEHPSTGERFYTAYAHMEQDEVFVKAGDKVKAGQRVAMVGNTGNSTGPHLHFEVHDPDNKPIDPWQWLHDQNAAQPNDNCSTAAGATAADQATD